MVSGACVYEFNQKSNGYGLVSLVRAEQKEAEFPSGRASRLRHKDVAETRETELGTLHLYDEFVHLGNRLKKARDVESGASEQLSGGSELEIRVSREQTALARRLGEGWKVPESCVDWDAIGRELGVEPLSKT